MLQEHALAPSEFLPLRETINQQLLPANAVETHPERQLGVTYAQTARVEQGITNSDPVKQTMQLIQATNQKNVLREV